MYSDADWVGDVCDQVSTSGYLLFLDLIILVGRLRSNPPSHIPLLKRTTVLFQMLLLNYVGEKSFA